MSVENQRSIPHVVQFSPAGKRAWCEMIDAHHAEQRSADFPQSLAGPWAKLEQYAGRIAPILHMLGLAADPLADSLDIPDVSARTIHDVARLLAYLKSHTRRVTEAMKAKARGEEGSDDVQCVLKWVFRHRGESFSLRDLTRDLARTFGRRAKALNNALDWLAKRHCIRLQDVPKGAEKKGVGREEVADLRRQSPPVRVAELPESRVRPEWRYARQFRRFCDGLRGHGRKGGWRWPSYFLSRSTPSSAVCTGPPSRGGATTRNGNGGAARSTTIRTRASASCRGRIVTAASAAGRAATRSTSSVGSTPVCRLARQSGSSGAILRDRPSRGRDLATPPSLTLDRNGRRVGRTSLGRSSPGPRADSGRTRARKAHRYLAGRGLTEDTNRVARLGFWPHDEWFSGIYPDRKVFVPAGVVIPWFDGPDVTLLNVRRTEGGPKYQAVRGSRREGLYPGREGIVTGKPLVIVEGELDALVLGQEVQGVAAVVTLGSAGTRPPPAS